MDTETTGLDPFSDKVTLIQTYFEDKIRFSQPKPGKISKLKNLLEDKNNLIIGHNLKFDLKFLKYHFDIEPAFIFDTWVAEILLSGGMKARSRNTTTLEVLAGQYANINMNKNEETRQSFKSDVLTPEQINYAAMDVAVLPAIFEKQQELLKQSKLEAVFATEMNCLPAVVWMELSGVPFDMEGLKKLKVEIENNLEIARIQVLTAMKDSGYKNLDLFGMPAVDLNSPLKLKTALQKIGLKVEDTNDSTISALDHPVAKSIRQYRKFQKMLNSFLDKLPKHVNPKTQRIHANFSQMGTLAGRFSCSKPNLQQIPKDNKIRNLIKAAQGYKIIKGDYSQIELRLLGEVAQEPKFIKLFNDGGDLHKLTASLIFNKPVNEIKAEERSIAKIINFGLNYGMSWMGLQTNLQDAGIIISKEESRKYIDVFFNNYPMIKEYLDHAGNFAVDNCFIRNKAGRLIKYKPPVDERDRSFIFREGKNNPIQSLNADILKIAMGRLHKRLKEYNIKLINAVHDELVFEAAEERAESAALIIKEEMETAGQEFLKTIPCIVDIKIANTWD